ncbi:MAG: acyl carrier protein [Acutalibacteraceae bacterium]
MLEMLREFICDFSNVPPESITEETNIRTEVPMDSISLLNLAVAIENEFGIELTEEDLKEIETVGDFLRLIENRK